MTGVRNLAWFSGALLVAVIALLLARIPFAGNIEAHGASVAAPIASALRDATRPITDVLLHAGQLGELSRENASLRQELARAQAELAAVREQRAANEEITALQQAAGELGSRVTAPVLLRDPAPGRQMLLIGRGTADGVHVGQPVLGPGATLVGVVAAADVRRARVRLLHDSDSAVAAVLQSSRVQGSLIGSGEGLRLDMVAATIPVATGDLVLTSALGGLLPPGLLIGRVANVDTRSEDLVARIRVEPLVDYNRLEQVLVLTDARQGLSLTNERPR
ncbi:MAG: rod shape-determining protein MreC [Dehalococcoidia bacterium]|nr:MAG: rod shape-determining protein MreC [Dehalococcoidia bacterium]